MTDEIRLATIAVYIFSTILAVGIKYKPNEHKQLTKYVVVYEEPELKQDLNKVKQEIYVNEPLPDDFEEFMEEFEKAEKKEVDLALNPPKPKPKKQVVATPPKAGNANTGVLTRAKGVNYYNGIKETYYNLPMGGVVNIGKSMGIPGEYWVRADGVKMYGDYVMVAANLSQYPRGSIVYTSLGAGIVLDTGGMGYNWFDIAVNW